MKIIAKKSSGRKYLKSNKEQEIVHALSLAEANCIHRNS